MFIEGADVLFDYTQGVCRLFDISLDGPNDPNEPDVYESRWKDAGADLASFVGLRSDYDQQLASRVQEAGAAFWRNLSPCRGWLTLLDAVEKVDPLWRFVDVTTTLDSERAAGVTQWVTSHLGRHFRRYVSIHDVSALTGKHRMLISADDNRLQQFVDAGGIGMLVPRYHNAGRSTLIRHHDSLLGVAAVLNSRFARK